MKIMTFGEAYFAIGAAALVAAFGLMAYRGEASATELGAAAVCALVFLGLVGLSRHQRRNEDFKSRYPGYRSRHGR